MADHWTSDTPPIHLVHHEIVSVTSAMRKNSRWAQATYQPGLYAAVAPSAALASSMGLRDGGAANGGSGVKGKRGQRRPAGLMAGFVALRVQLNEVDDVFVLDALTLLSPFLQVIRSGDATGPITLAALSAVERFLQAGLIHPGSPGLAPALAALSSAATHCKFEASDGASDEAVLLRILGVIERLLCSEVGEACTDEAVCEMMETGLSMCCQMRLSEMLRRSAEHTMQAMVRRVFERLKTLSPPSLSAVPSLPADEDPSSSDDGGPAALRVAAPDPRSRGVPAARTAPAQAPEDVAEDGEPTLVPYGLPSVTELLRVLISLLDPHNAKHTDTMRLAALGILDVALTTGGRSIVDWEELRKMLCDGGCKFLFQLARSESPTILTLTLRVINALFDTLRAHLKLQQELFLSFLIDRVTPASTASLRSHNPSAGAVLTPTRPGTPADAASGLSQETESDPLLAWSASLDGSATPPLPPARAAQPAHGETRELMLESLGYLARRSGFMPDLWVNYDSDLDCEDLFEKMIWFLSRGVFPSGNVPGNLQENAQVLCLDAVLAFVSHMSSRLETEGVGAWPSNNPSPEHLQQIKTRKRILLDGAARFNTKPKLGLAYLEEHGIIEAGKPRTLAAFLKSCPRLDKRLLGDYISRPDNVEVLNAFLATFDFKGKTIAEGMREVLETFRLPGEAQQIARITETFAERYFASEPPEIKSQDAAYVLAYSVIMLNTDLHNPQNRARRMAVDDYKRNLRGVNDGSDFPPEYLSAIYNSIRKREIVMPEEHHGQLGFEYAWKEMLRRSVKAGSLIACDTPIFDRQMFELAWKPVISALSYAFTTFQDEYLLQRAIAGFRQCATLAKQFSLPEVFDFIVMSLSRATGLLVDDTSATDACANPIVEVEGQSLRVSSLSVNFGTNLRGQLAAVVLFNIANGNGNAIRSGWTQIFEMLQTLFINSLLPQPLLQMEDFLGGATLIPLSGSPLEVQEEERRRPSETGLLSTLSSYLLSPYSSSAEAVVPEATEDDVESTLCTVDCITSCKIEELYSQITSLEGDAFIAAVQALRALADRRTVDRLAARQKPPSSPYGNGEAPNSSRRNPPLPYDRAALFLLETMVSVVSRSPEHIVENWPIVFDHLSALLSSAQDYSILLIERAVVGLLRLTQVIADKPELRDQVYVSIDILRTLSPPVLNAVAEQLIAGVVKLIEQHAATIQSSTEWGLLLSLFSATTRHPEAAGASFNVLVRVATNQLGNGITPDNFSAIISTLNDFASAAGSSASSRQQRQRRGSSKTPVDVASEPTVERGLKAVELLYELRTAVPPLIEQSTSDKDQAWKSFWLPPLCALAGQCVNRSREVRQLALGHLQKELLSPEISAGGADIKLLIVFDKILFPMLVELLKPEVFQRDPVGMRETRLRASALLCRILLNYLAKLAEDQVLLLNLWLKVLDFLDRFMNSGQRDQLYEAIPESLKNVVLVMNASDYLLPPSHPDRDAAAVELWDRTADRVGQFLPGFLEELFPAPPEPPVESGTTDAAKPPATESA